MNQPQAQGPLSPPLAALALAVLGPPEAAADGDDLRIAMLRRVQADPAVAWRRWIAAPPAADTALRTLAGELELGTAETLAAAWSMAAETDLATARVLGLVQGLQVPSPAPAGLVADVAARLDGRLAAHHLAALSGGPAQRAGLIAADAGSAPWVARALRMPVPLALLLSSGSAEWPTVEPGGAALPPLASGVRSQLPRQAAACAAETPGLVIRCGHPLEGRAVATALAREMGLQAAVLRGEPAAALTAPGFGLWAWLQRRLPVVALEMAPGEQRELPACPGYCGPIIVLAGPDGTVLRDGQPLPGWTIPVPTPAERVALWQQALDAPALAATLGADHRHAAGRIHGLAQAARFQARFAGVAEPGAAEVAQAACGGAAADLGAIAELLPDAIPAEALVLPAALQQELDALHARCVARDAIGTELGPALQARRRWGVRALFVGPSGTGKTLAAGWLAARIGLPLYRVDLASITSKYIGETEKNLARLFARAEHAEVVLMFDEADALFGKRTDVKDAHDRYANAQTNYLLQRIESFDGIVILTSNSRARFDSAFARRLDAILEFGLPGPDERRALWRAHLGDAPGIAAAELNRLAAGCELAGGHIRNAVLHAASRARAQGRAIEAPDLLDGLAAEYRKLGKALPTLLAAR